MRQTAPDPQALADLVEHMTYKPRWRFTLEDVDRGQGSEGLTLVIRTSTPDSNAPEDGPIGVIHYMPVPPAAYDRRSWQHWLLDQLVLVERHEACEFFKVDGVRPYNPSHGPGNDPYLVREIGTVDDAETNFLGGRGARRK